MKRNSSSNALLALNDDDFMKEEVIQFIECIKTDLELNKDFERTCERTCTDDASQPPSSNGGSSNGHAELSSSPSSSSHTHMPVRTPSGASGPNANMWAVQWKKGPDKR